jgi:uncharacterized GH25 family protein
MTQMVKQPSKTYLSDQRAFVEAVVEWVAVISTSWRSTNHTLLREMVQLVNPDFSEPVENCS